MIREICGLLTVLFFLILKIALIVGVVYLAFTDWRLLFRIFGWVIFVSGVICLAIAFVYGIYRLINNIRNKND